MSTRSALALLALAAAVPVPAAAAAKPKLYSVSLGGTTRTELTQVRPLDPPGGCTGSANETNHFLGSATLVPKPRGVPFDTFGPVRRLKFNVVLRSLHAEATHETAGSYAVDPNEPFPPPPGTCTFTPEKRTARCTFPRDATARQGAEFALLPHGRIYELYYNRSAGIVNCEPDDLSGKIFGEFVQTKLRVSAVKALGVGRSVSTSATSVFPARESSTTGGETDKYTLKVKRVR
jgi:hypothetical protein